ncbi:MAG: DUF4446 family protein [Lachnospiraceae bacterium]|nr:DUF4446 family protein [Lachnospiraceae bacterium]
MNLFNEFGIDGSYVVIGLAVFMLLEFILIIVLFNKNKNTRRKYEVFMQGNDAASLERLFTNKFSMVDSLKEKTEEIDQHLAKIDENLLITYQKIGIVKYDAFDMGGKLSFAVALLNDTNDGIIINSVHSTREGCYTYAKEIIKGESFVILSNEEKEALEMAIQSK